MAINQLKYGQRLEKELAKGKSFGEAHKIASEQSVAKEANKHESVMERVARKLKEIYYGEKTYSEKKFSPAGKK